MKLSDKIEKKIENLIDKNIKKNLSNPEKLGRVKRLESGTKNYLKILRVLDKLLVWILIKFKLLVVMQFHLWNTNKNELN